MSKTGLSKGKVAWISAGSVLALILAAIVGVGIYYSNHALPGTSVAGRDVSGMTREQVAEEVQGEIDSNVLTLDGVINPVEVKASEVGIDVNVDSTVDEVFAPNRGLITRFTGLFSSHEVMPVVQVNDQQLDDFLESLESDAANEPQDGTVTFDAEQQAFVAHPSVVGTRIDVASASKQITNAVSAMSFTPIDVSLVEVTPDYDAEAAQAAANKANLWLDTDVSLVDRNGDFHTADTDAKVAWIKFDNNDGVLQATTDPQAVRAWVDEHSAESNVAPEAKLENVNSSGKVLSVAYEGTDGYVASNGEALANALAESLAADTPFVGEIEYTVQERPVEQRQIAEGAENLVYQAAEGERWIDINLSTHTVTAYEGATAVLQSPMVAGAPATPTVTGEYNVWAKVANQTMRGSNADGSRYETPNVPWILYFHGGYATHGAYWRGSFGYDAGAGGSHGCVNMPVDQAKALYDWADVGTKVVSHH